MGAYSPAPVMTPAMIERDDGARSSEPTMRGMAAARHALRGRAVRRADDHRRGPEADRIQCPLRRSRMPGADDAAEGRSPRRCCTPPPTASSRTCRVRWRDEAALTVVMAAKGYPGAYGNGLARSAASTRPAADGRRDLPRRHGARRTAQLVADGGRVLNVTAIGATRRARRRRAPMRRSTAIDWPDGFCRRDIGWRAIERESGGR